jgi:hypothetical protein
MFMPLGITLEAEWVTENNFILWFSTKAVVFERAAEERVLGGPGGESPSPPLGGVDSSLEFASGIVLGC